MLASAFTQKIRMALKLRQVPYCKLLFFMEMIKILPAEEKKQPTSSLKNKSIEKGMMGACKESMSSSDKKICGNIRRRGKQSKFLFR